MATIPTASIISRASILLQDVANIRWPQLELLDWLNDGQREVALYKPNACVRNTDVVLAPGTKQYLPADGNSLVDMPRNTNGAAIRITARGVLDAQVPDWHLAAKASAKVAHYCYSELDPKTFYVYPPSPGGNSVELIYNASPANTALAGVISIDDIYASALVDYVMYRAYSKDSEYAASGQTASNHYQAFISAIRGKASAKAATDPSTRNPGIPK